MHRIQVKRVKILTVIGARPQFIKAAAVSREMEHYSDIQEVIVHTGQHFDTNMSEVFFEQMQIPRPDYNLDINGLTHGAMTGQMIEKIEVVLIKEKPDWVIVYGDTNSTLAGALAAKKLHIKVAHVEAGLRSFNMNMPEEINRILTDRISDILFCPTQNAINNLLKEGYDNFDCTIVKSGDVMKDAADFYRQYQLRPNSLLTDDEFILCTVHRAENTDNLERLESIVAALNEISKEINVVFPVHPRTRKILSENKIDVDFILLDPVGYLEMVYLLENCKFVMTDSGGLQKEAYFFKKHCVTLRDETEWLELVEQKVNTLAGANYIAILSGYRSIQDDGSLFNVDLYGDGKASKAIIKEIKECST